MLKEHEEKGSKGKKEDKQRLRRTPLTIPYRLEGMYGVRSRYLKHRAQVTASKLPQSTGTGTSTGPIETVFSSPTTAV